MGSSLPSSSLAPLAAWRSRRASLYRCTLREIAAWVVTDMTGKRCSLQTPFLAKDSPSVPPTMLAASWSMEYFIFYLTKAAMNLGGQVWGDWFPLAFNMDSLASFEVSMISRVSM